MCGFIGFINFKDINKTLIKNFSNSIYNRGPDSYGDYIDEKKDIYLAHRRLSIIDISEFGSQPMVSTSGRYVILFNGEIYNHKVLKKQLSSYKFTGNSDTEILLASIEFNGFRKTIEQLEGMFSIALLDKNNHKLYLARDRFGEKPLYYFFNNNKFFFSSDISFLKNFDLIDKKIDNESLNLYFSYNYIPYPKSIYSKVSKLEPSNILEYDIKNQKINKNQYYNIKKLFKKNKSSISFEKSSENLEKLLLNKIEDQLICDVEKGTFLSGGIDSSLITALIAKNIDSNITAFTIGFNNEDYDEVKKAKSIAKHLNINHHYEYLTNNNLIDIIEKMPSVYSEPFADSSQVPTYFLCSIANKKIKVALSGDGGDELFGGYNRYKFSEKYKNHINYTPYVFRKFIKYLFLNNKYNLIKKIFKKITTYIEIGNKYDLKFQKIMKAIDFKNKSDIYNALTTNNFFQNNFNNINLNLNPAIKNIDFNQNFTEKQMMADILTYLTDDILCKVDRASMANSLEVRSPFLNHEIVEFAISLPMSHKIDKNGSKKILRKILSKYLPEGITNSPKLGFSFPLSSLIENELKDYFLEKLSSSVLSNYFKKEELVKLVNNHSKMNDNSNLIWSILMFQKWLENK